MSLSSKKCCVPGCFDSGNSHKTLHLFPNPDKERQRFNEWVLSIGGDILGLNNDDIYQHRRVCHNHFDEKVCCRFNRISNIAVPTLGLPGPLSLPKFTFNERRALRSLQASSVIMPSTSAGEQGLFMEPHCSYEIKHSKATTDNENIDPTPRADLTICQSVTKKNSEGSQTLDLQRKDIPQMPPTPEVINEVTCDPSDKTRPKQRGEHDSSQEITEAKQKKCGKCMVKTGAIATKRTKKNLIVTATEHNLYKKLIKTKIQLSKCRSKLKKQSLSIRSAKNITTNPSFLATLENLPSTAKLLTLLQFREHKKKGKGRRFKLEEKILALSILKQAPKGYRFLRKIFVLPAPQTLAKLITEANVQPGINPKIFAQLKKVTGNMKVEDKLCVLLFDEMSLKPSVNYNERKDKVVGFETDGQTTKAEFADHAQVFMIRGMIRNYKQAIAYTFSAGGTKGPALAKQIKAIVSNLQEAGFIVVATVCDQGSSNRQAIKILVQETRGAFLRSGREPKNNIFVVSDQEITPLYDPPHLLKCVRNNLLTKNLEYKSDDGSTRLAKWEHLEMLHKENPGYKGLRLIPKLTENHILPTKIPKMKVKYASQIFSRCVATNMGYLADKGILPKESTATADILLFFDNLFDSVNGSHAKKEKKFSKPLLGPVTPISSHHEEWRKARKMLLNMKFSPSNEYVPTLKNWEWTLEGIEVLLANLQQKYSVTSVWMRHLNQDPIENFFGSIRSHGCRNTNPTPAAFESAFLSLLINNVSSVHSPAQNCEKDLCEILHVLIVSEEKKSNSELSFEFESVPDITLTSLQEKKKDPRIIGVLEYISGYFIKRAQGAIFRSCAICKETLMAKEETEYIKYRQYTKKRWLINPSQSVVECVSAMQDTCYTIMQKHAVKGNIKEFLKTIIIMHLDFAFIKCGMHQESLITFLVQIVVRFFVNNYCKLLNKILCGKREVEDVEDSIQIKAKKRFHKCAKRKI